jgi:hypothetical protein
VYGESGGRQVEPFEFSNPSYAHLNGSSKGDPVYSRYAAPVLASSTSDDDEVLAGEYADIPAAGYSLTGSHAQYTNAPKAPNTYAELDDAPFSFVRGKTVHADGYVASLKANPQSTQPDYFDVTTGGSSGAKQQPAYEDVDAFYGESSQQPLYDEPSVLAGTSINRREFGNEDRHPTLTRDDDAVRHPTIQAPGDYEDVRPLTQHQPKYLDISEPPAAEYKEINFANGGAAYDAASEEVALYQSPSFTLGDAPAEQVNVKRQPTYAMGDAPAEHRPTYAMGDAPAEQVNVKRQPSYAMGDALLNRST